MAGKKKSAILSVNIVSDANTKGFTEAARAAQSHIGLARALARDPELREQRRRIVRALEVLDLTGDHRPNLPAWTYAVPGVLSHGSAWC